MAATLSVVVPVYGTKRNLPACLESLRTQSLRDAEFLLVDDASPDGAGAVLAEYARRDSRFRVLTHSQNRGLFAARMTGADAATGKYPRFSGQRRFCVGGFLPCRRRIGGRKRL